MSDNTLWIVKPNGWTRCASDKLLADAIPSWMRIRGGHAQSVHWGGNMQMSSRSSWFARSLAAARVMWLVGCLTPQLLVAQEQQQTTGVRARLYWIGDQIDAGRELAPNQSPNIDRTISSFDVTGKENWFRTDGRHYQRNYVLVLEADVAFEQQEGAVLRLQSEALSMLLIDGEPFAAAEDGDDVEEEFHPHGNVHRLKLIQYVGDDPPAVTLQWSRDEDAPFQRLPSQVLTAPDFYFRPTNGAAKRLVALDDRPGLREKVDGVYPGCDLMTIRPVDVDVPVGGLDVLPDGRLVVATFDARRLRAPAPQEDSDGELWIYSHVDATDRKDVRRERIATGLFEPCGVCTVEDAIYVSQRHEITRFDRDDQGIWQPTTVATGWETNDFHALSFGLVHRPGDGEQRGALFMARGTGLGLMKNPPNHGSVWRVDLDQPAGANVQALTGGHRTPNGIGFGPAGELFVTDNQGEYTPANELNHVVPGSFYGFVHRTSNGGAPTPFQDQPVRQPAVILPQDEIANSPTEPVMIPANWPYAGQLLVGDVKYGGINRISLEKIRGRWQGAAYRFTQGLEGGVNRLVFDRRGNLFVGGIGGDHASTWNWVDPAGEKTYLFFLFRYNTSILCPSH